MSEVWLYCELMSLLCHKDFVNLLSQFLATCLLGCVDFDLNFLHLRQEVGFTLCHTVLKCFVLFV